jgi:hypothetical protein
MGINFKNFLLLSCIAFVITMSSCKPDAIVANYSCTKHYYFYKSPGTAYDSVIGFAAVMVYKSSSDGSTLIINGKTNGVYAPQYSNGSQNAYITDYASDGTPQLAYFITGSDSIWMQANLQCGEGYRSYYYYAGHKNSQ